MDFTAKQIMFEQSRQRVVALSLLSRSPVLRALAPFLKDYGNETQIPY